MSKFFNNALAVVVGAGAALTLSVAGPAQAAAAKVVATPGQIDLGSLAAGAKKTVSFTLENQGAAEA